MKIDLACHDTIAALATAPGAAAIAVVRVSGPRADALREQLFRPRRPGPFRAAELRLGDVVALATSAGEGSQAAQAEVVDEGLCAWFPAERSYTGETAFELQVHGGELNSQRVLALACAAGARLAEPGEFTLRAFVHGRIDLSQAEAVQQVVSARSRGALELAQRALRGAAGQSLAPIGEGLTELLAELEARLDFPEEDLGSEVRERIWARAQELLGAVQRQRASAGTAARLCERPRVLLCGPPNAGKSTLLNVLCERERALTHAEPGTTRDLLEVEALLDDCEVTLIDSAGLRAAAEGIETEAVARARGAVAGADLAVLVLDASRPLDSDDRAALDELGTDAILVANKADLELAPSAVDALGDTALVVSALRGQGLGPLRAAIEARVRPPAQALEAGWLVTLERHAESLAEAEAALQEAIGAARSGLAEEVVALELRRGLDAVNAILGNDASEDVLRSIFSRFCIGK